MAVHMQSIVLMFLFVTVEKLAARPGPGNSDTCYYKHLTEPSHCKNSSKIEVHKDNTTYSLRLCSDANNNCGTQSGMWLLSEECKDVCKACRKLTGGNNFCPSTKVKCEEMMDTFLNDYCKSATADIECITTTIPTTIVSPSQCIATVTTTIPYIETVSVSLPCSQTPTSTPLDQTIMCTNMNGNLKTSSKTALSRNLTTTIMALGALLGLSVMLLAMVIMGWVCTCIIRKKRNRIIKNSTESDEKYFENPTYDGTSMIRLHGAIGPGVHRVPALPVAAQRPQANDPEAMHAMYDAINTGSPETVGKGQTYDVLDRDKGKINGKQSTARNVKAPKGYSQLGLPDKDVDNNYHLINKEND